MGTRSFAIEQAIGQAIDFHLMIGAERKAKRLHYLKNYWAEQIADLPKVKLYTSLQPEFGGAIALLGIEGRNPIKVANILQNKYFIHVTNVQWEKLLGIRITPNVYTLKSELDKLVRALKEIIL